MTIPHKLYGAEVSLYSGKIRAYLRWKKIQFEEIIASREIYKSVIFPRVGWPVIPVIVTDRDETLQDTSDMIDYFEERYPDNSVYPETPKQKLAALLLEVYGDEWLVIPAMHYRWNHNREWVMREFGALSAPDASEEDQYARGKETAKPFAGALPFLGVTDATVPAIEQSYEALLRDLDAHFARYPYVLGDRPSIADFGLIGPLYAHNYRDPESGKLMKRIAPNVAAWVERVEFGTDARYGDFIADDEIPETLVPVLRRMMDEQMPVLANTVAKYEEWANSTDEKEVPRAIGMHSFMIEGRTGERAIFPFNQWMLQRPYDFLQSLTGQSRQQADDLLAKIGGGVFMRLEIKARVCRENFKLVRTAD